MRSTELYIHIPFCMKKCAYCDFLSGPYDAEIRKHYTKALIKEMKYHSLRMSDCEIVTVYIGGGTPTWLEAKHMEKIIKSVFRFFHVAPDAEFTMEVNPATASQKDFELYHSLGVNRLSIGLQSVNQEELEILGRVHDFGQFLNTYDYAKKAGFDNINVDIMTGIPGQTPGSLHNTIEQLVRLRPEHISCYALIIEEGTPFYDKYKFDVERRNAGMPTEELPNEDEEYELYKYAQKELISHGYGQYEISNYARMGKSCRHNIGYWKRVPYLGVGLGAASLLDEIRYTNPSNIYEYIDNVNADKFPVYVDANPVSRPEAMAEFMYLGLRMNEGVSRKEFEDCFGANIEAMYGPVLENLMGQGLLELFEGRYCLTERGMDVGNYAMAQFLP